MKLLILSCNTGGGHNTAAYAIKAAAEKMGHEAEVKDYLLLAGEKTSKRLVFFATSSNRIGDAIADFCV